MTGNAKDNHPASIAHRGVTAVDWPPSVHSAFRTFALQLLGGVNNSAEASRLAMLTKRQVPAKAREWGPSSALIVR